MKSSSAIGIILLALANQIPSSLAQMATEVIPGDSILVPGYIAEAIASSNRPIADKLRDTGRRPAEIMSFFDVRPGDMVAELITGGGYYASILSGIVGDSGKVYGHANDWFMGRQKAGSPLLKRIASGHYSNVEEVVFELEDIALPVGGMDAIFVFLIYHDAVGAFQTDRVRMNKGIYAALKPGGIYGVIDHHSSPGLGISDTTKNHRIERHVVVEEIIAAGFDFDEETDLLENLNDPLDVSVFNPSVRGNTHRMVLKFRKPQ